MKNFTILILLLVNAIGCMNKVEAEIPNKIEQCFKDPKTGDCTNQAEIIVKHIITIALPDVFTNSCKTKWNETDYPDPVIREVGYQQCISDYLSQVVSVINGLNPQDLPIVPQ